MRKAKRLLLLGLVTAILIGTVSIAVACKSASLSFDDGDNITIDIGETRMMSFTAEPALSSGTSVWLTSSDNHIVEIVGDGYIRGVGEGTADVTLSADGIKATDSISVTVKVPSISEENRFLVNADSQTLPNLFAEVSDDVPANTRIYAVAEKDGNRVGTGTAEVLPNKRVYIAADELGMTDGIYTVGFGFVGYETGKVISVFMTDAVTSRSLVEGEDWSFYNSENSSDGTLSIVDDSIKHGGASIVFDIEQRADGSFINPYFQIRAEKGTIWSVKLRRGNGENNLYEEVVLGDSAVSDVSVCTFDLNDYAYYVYGGQVTLVIYAVQGPLTINDVTNYSSYNAYEQGVSEDNYVELESVSISAPEKPRVGETYHLTVKYSPANASFRSLRWVAENDNITVDGSGAVTVNKPGECKISAVGADGKEYGQIVLNGTIAVTGIQFTSTAGEVVVALAQGSYDLSSEIAVFPETASDKSVTYSILSEDGGGFSVGNDGKITFTQTGSAVVRISSNDNVNVWREFTLTVVESLVPAQSVEILGIETTMLIGEQFAFMVNVLPTNATYTDVVLVSQNEGILSVKDGVVTALRGGTTTLSAYSKDGAAYDSVEIRVRAALQTEVDPSDYDYGMFELGGEIEAGDVVTVTVFKGDESLELLQTTIHEAEQDVNGKGGMDAQRRIYFTLTDEIFSEESIYEFEITVTRSGEPLQGYSYGKFILGTVVKDITDGNWQNGYQAAPSAENGVTATLTADGFGNITQSVNAEDISGARYLLVKADSRTADKISVKLSVNGREITIATGDCTSLGVFKFDLTDPEIASLLQGAENVSVNLYVIGKDGTSAAFGEVLFVTEDFVK